jgi:hypothetical protein
MFFKKGLMFFKKGLDFFYLDLVFNSKPVKSIHIC